MSPPVKTGNQGPAQRKLSGAEASRDTLLGTIFMTGPRHNSREAEGIASDQLCNFISRVERLQDEIDALNTDKSEVFKEAKSLGYDVSAMKVVTAERRKMAKNPQKFAEVSEIADLYRSIVGTGIATHASARDEE